MYDLSNISKPINVKIKIEETLENFGKNFCFLNSDIKLEFYSKNNYPKEKDNDTDSITIKFKDYGNQIKDIFNNNFFFFLEDEKFLIEKIENLEDDHLIKLTTILKKIDINNNSISKTNTVRFLFLNNFLGKFKKIIFRF